MCIEIIIRALNKIVRLDKADGKTLLKMRDDPAVGFCRGHRRPGGELPIRVAKLVAERCSRDQQKEQQVGGQQIVPDHNRQLARAIDDDAGQRRHQYALP